MQHGRAWRSAAGLGEVLVADGSTEGAGLPCCSLRRVVLARPGEVRRGVARRSSVWQGNSCRRQHGESRFSLLLSSESRQGGARRGAVWWGQVRFDRVEPGPASNCCRRQHRGLMLPLLLSLESRLGMAWIGRLRTGAVGRGEVIAADGSTELRKRLPAALFGG